MVAALSDNIFQILSLPLSLGGALFLLYLTFLQLSIYLNPLRKLSYPPGPPPRDFILGNARDLVSSPLWVKLTEWAPIYGPIVHLRAFNRHLIVVNSIDDAVELMEKRSNNNSDRPYFPMLDLIGATFTTALKPYGPAWHAHRRLLQQMFRPIASLEYRPIQVEKVNDMLYSLLDTPEDFLTHIKTLSVSIVMSAMYGYKVSPKNDRFQELAEEAVNGVNASAFSGAIINIFPFLRFLPAWFPGAGFHRSAQVVKEKIDRMQDVPYKYVQDNLAAGTASPSFIAHLIDTCKSKEDHTLLKEVTATGYGAGADTITSAVETFMYAMAKFPDVQRKGQQELDGVIGTDRLASYIDEASLPYIQAIYREVLRWRPVLPLGIFHAATADDVYNGYYIPKGTALIPNIWAMTRDPAKYKNPEEFDPDRFFDANNQLNNDDVTYAFGFGRRICPGRHMAAATLWLAIATILSTFDIRAPKDDSGKEIPLNIGYTDGLISHPRPFKCIITPRSVQAKQLIVDIRDDGI